MLGYILDIVLIIVIIFLLIYINKQKKIQSNLPTYEELRRQTVKLSHEIDEQKLTLQKNQSIIENTTKQIEQTKENLQKHEAALSTQIQIYNTTIQNQNNELENNKQKNLQILEEQNKLIENNKEKNELIVEEQHKQLQYELESNKEMYDICLQHWKEKELDEYTKSISNMMASIKKENSEELQILLDEMKERCDEIYNELNTLKKQRESYYQQLQKEKELEEQSDFYRLILSENDLQDITYLIDLSSRLHKPVLFKLIWSEYIQGAFKQMLKNVLGNRDPRNVIYIITNTKTKQVYIGKTKSEVSKRWTEHLKTSLGIGASANKNLIHKALYKNWGNFTFQILEEVGKDGDLAKQEKYWIDFYQSDVYGYNQISGG